MRRRASTAGVQGDAARADRQQPARRRSARATTPGQDAGALRAMGPHPRRRTTIPVYDKPEQQAWRTWAVGLAHAARRATWTPRAATLAQMKRHVGRRIGDAAVRWTIAELELEATITARSGDTAKGYALFRKAAEMEAALTLHRAAVVSASGGRRAGRHRAGAWRSRGRREGVPRSARPRARQRPRLLRAGGVAARVEQRAGRGGDGARGRVRRGTRPTTICPSCARRWRPPAACRSDGQGAMG